MTSEIAGVLVVATTAIFIAGNLFYLTYLQWAGKPRRNLLLFTKITQVLEVLALTLGIFLIVGDWLI